VRKLLFVFLTSLAAMGAHAWDSSTDDSHPEGTFAQPPYAEALVTIAPVPMPAMVTELASYSPQNTVRQARTVKAAKVAHAKSMLSRSARGQIALASTAAKADDHERLDASDDEDDDLGIDDQDLHRSFSQPKVAKKPDQADDGDKSAIDLPDHIKLRLLMARTKAVDAYILSQAGKASTNTADEALPEHVKLRLFLARTLAVKAHADKFGPA
jgi:hypothetical protein